MSQSTYSIRMDSDLKKDFVQRLFMLEPFYIPCSDFHAL